MTDNELLDAINAKTFEDGDKIKLTCASAFQIAAKTTATLKDIGRLCNENDIRITKCQIGCFE
jgi:hypothetical protein